MNPFNIKSGWWVSTDSQFVACYDSKEKAIKHIEYQKKVHPNKSWYLQYIDIKFGEAQTF